MLHVFLLELFVVEIGVVAFVLKQLFVRALLDDLACADDLNKVGVADGREAVRNEERGSVFKQRRNGVLNELFGFGIDGRGGFV